MKKLVLSKEVVDLESGNTKLDFVQHYKETCESDPVFSEILDYFQDMLAEQAKDYFGQLQLVVERGDIEYIRVEKATDVLNKAMLNLYYLMQVQAEINEIEPKSGKKAEGK
jgi:hypothetical protein